MVLINVLKFFGILEKVSLKIDLRKYLYYINIDQTRPLNFSQKSRNCHIKFMSIDGQVAIMGNGNMDTQSWFHSEVNQQNILYLKHSFFFKIGNQCYD